MMKKAARSSGTMEKKVLITLLLLVVLSVCIFFSVYLVQLNRQLYGEVEKQRSESIVLQAEWSRLLLEHSVYSDQGRIERIAKERLGMVRPGQQVHEGVAQAAIFSSSTNVAN